jgi:hypothetical protein
MLEYAMNVCGRLHKKLVTTVAFKKIGKQKYKAGKKLMFH